MYETGYLNKKSENKFRESQGLQSQEIANVNISNGIMYPYTMPTINKGLRDKKSCVKF